jgi:site-specific DNA-cytosine methylase
MAEKQWMDLGYQVTHFLTGGILHGVPQRRLRWHMFAHKVKLVFPDNRGPVVRTMRDAFDKYGLPKERYGQAPGSPRIEPLQRYAQNGCKYRDVYTFLTGIQDSEVGLYAGVPHYSLRRGEWDRSVPTLVGTPRVYMPKPEKRLYSVGEGLVMCGYPKRFELVARNTRDAYDQIAKGILPPLARYLGSIAKESLEQGIKIRKPHEPEIVDWTHEARSMDRLNPRIPKMPERLWGIHKEWLVRKRDE